MADCLAGNRLPDPHAAPISIRWMRFRLQRPCRPQHPPAQIRAASGGERQRGVDSTFGAEKLWLWCAVYSRAAEGVWIVCRQGNPRQMARKLLRMIQFLAGPAAGAQMILASHTPTIHFVQMG